jgi:hypothetical protein
VLVPIHRIVRHRQARIFYLESLGDRIMGYIDRLIESCKKAKDAKPRHEFTIKVVPGVENMDPPELKGISTAIYIIKQTSGSPEETFEAMVAYKKTKERSCPALNEDNKNSGVMYVGSSTTGVGKRIKQHLGRGHPGTYALHLSHWFHDECTITVQQYDQPREVLQIIEDDLSDRLKPAFGKQGSNNK